MIPDIRGGKVCHADIKAVTLLIEKILSTVALLIVKLDSKLLNLA